MLHRSQWETCFSTLGKEKARLKDAHKHASWLRIYAIKLEPGIYVITGGAIKLIRTMQEREHTLQELTKMEMVRSHLLKITYSTKIHLLIL